MKCWRRPKNFSKSISLYKNAGLGAWYKKSPSTRWKGASASGLTLGPWIGARARALGPLSFTLRKPGWWKLRLPTTGLKICIRIKKGKKQIHTLFVFLYKRSRWCDGSSAHTCKNKFHWLETLQTSDSQGLWHSPFVAPSPTFPCQRRKEIKDLLLHLSC